MAMRKTISYTTQKVILQYVHIQKEFTNLPGFDKVKHVDNVEDVEWMICRRYKGNCWRIEEYLLMYRIKNSQDLCARK